MGWSGREVEEDAVQSRTGDSKAGGSLGNRDVGSFEQWPDGLHLLGGEFGGTAAFSTASTRRFKASNRAFPDQITFEFGERRKDMTRARRLDSSCLGKFWRAEPGKLSRAPKREPAPTVSPQSREHRSGRSETSQKQPTAKSDPA